MCIKETAVRHNKLARSVSLLVFSTVLSRFVVVCTQTACGIRRVTLRCKCSSIRFAVRISGFSKSAHRSRCPSVSDEKNIQNFLSRSSERRPVRIDSKILFVDNFIHTTNIEPKHFAASKQKYARRNTFANEGTPFTSRQTIAAVDRPYITLAISGTATGVFTRRVQCQQTHRAKTRTSEKFDTPLIVAPSPR